MESYCNSLSLIYEEKFNAEKGERSYGDDFILLFADLALVLKIF